MTLEFNLFLAIAAFIAGISSGLLGIGGGIVLIPLLIYIPPLLGFPKLSTHIVTGLVSMQTTMGTAASSFFHYKMGFVDYKIVFRVGIGIAAAAFLGSYFSKFLSEKALLYIYAFVLLVSALLMFLSHRLEEDTTTEIVKNIPKRKAFLVGFFTGLPAGALGIPGSTIIIPIVNKFLSVPIKVCIGSGANIAFIAAFMAFLGKLTSAQIILSSAFVISVSATIGAFLGSKISKRLSSKVLKTILLVLIILMFIRVAVELVRGY